MKYQNRYIMCDQVRNLVPSIMGYHQPRGMDSENGRTHLFAIGAVTFVYLVAMAFSA